MNAQLTLSSRDFQDAVIAEEVNANDYRYVLGDTWWTSEEIAAVDLPGETLWFQRERAHEPHPPEQKCRPSSKFQTLVVTKTEDGVVGLVVDGREVRCRAYAGSRDAAGQILASVRDVLPVGEPENDSLAM